MITIIKLYLHVKKRKNVYGHNSCADFDNFFDFFMHIYLY